eukprot:gnl/TRDRNA2_/TRDRNA2_145262_c0_seq1.p1 gnl/TRDRNA2_/TRDRNA2_145262_c0~~gnl/TRDRNA2_/TRDRNA2_145262_c0_seq1.p1  ORF type:complete len:175 (+),score=19.83 gnl/TRDRNA2_/TRDRNA2_145262_c0_seq1:26-526(+)
MCYVHMWRYAGHVLGIAEELLPKSLEEQEEFMLCSSLHQGVPEWIDGMKTKQFIDAFAKQANADTFGLVPLDALRTFLYQMTRYLNGNDYTVGMDIEDLGTRHWTIRLIRALGYLHGTLTPRLPLGEPMLFRAHTTMLRRRLNQWGTPVGHGAGSGARVEIPASRL